MAPSALESFQPANPFQRGLNLLLSCLAAISRGIDLSDVTLVKQNPKQKDGEGCSEGSAVATRTWSFRRSQGPLLLLYQGWCIVTTAFTMEELQVFDLCWAEKSV